MVDSWPRNVPSVSIFPFVPFCAMNHFIVDMNPVFAGATFYYYPNPKVYLLHIIQNTPQTKFSYQHSTKHIYKTIYEIMPSTFHHTNYKHSHILLRCSSNRID